MDLTPYAQTLVTNLGCIKGDKIAVVTDDAPFAKPTDEIPTREALARRFQEDAEPLGMDVDIVLYENLGRSGIEPGVEVFEAIYPEGFVDFAREIDALDALLDKSINEEQLEELRMYVITNRARYEAVLVLSRYSVSHTRFRKLITDSGITRAATMPGVEPYMFSGVMTADWPLVAQRSEAVARLLSSAATATLISPGDRQLTLSLAGRAGMADTGLLSSRGSFGNLPGGEAFIAPVEGSTEGELSVGMPDDPAGWGFRFAEGRMVEMLGDPPFADRIERAIAEHPDVRNVAELGVGTNEKASVPTNILEAEKILGTVHLALGDNASFGGTVSVPFHQDFVIYRPTLTLTDEDGNDTLVLDDGTFLL